MEGCVVSRPVLAPDASTYFIKNSPNDSATTGHKGRGSIGNATSTCPKSGWSDLHLTSNRSWSPMNFPTKTSPEIQSFGRLATSAGLLVLTSGADQRASPHCPYSASTKRRAPPAWSPNVLRSGGLVAPSPVSSSCLSHEMGEASANVAGNGSPRRCTSERGLGPNPRSLAIAACTSVVVIVGRTAHPARTCPPDKTSPTLGSIPAMISSPS